MSGDGINSADWIFKRAKDLETENAALELRVAELEKGMSQIIARCHDGYGDKWTINHIFDIAHDLIQKQATKKKKVT